MDELQAGLQQRLRRDLKACIPGLIASMVLHALLLFLCTLFYIRFQLAQSPPIELDWTQAVESRPGALPPAPVSVAMPSMSAPASTVRPKSESSRLQAVAPAVSISAHEARPVSVSRSLQLRKDPGRRRAFLDSASTNSNEDPLELALQWLAEQQLADGHWSLQGPYDDGGSVETYTGASSLALLCFLGDGQTHQAGKHRRTVQRGLAWLVENQRPDGDLFDIPEEGKEAHFYAHAQGTIALCEAIALTGDDSFRPAAERAVLYLVNAQNPALGGWKYRPLNEAGIGDLSVTGWALMALHSARMAEIEVPPEAFLLASRFLDSVQERAGDGSHYKYRPDFDAEDAQRWSMTAEGLLCRQWLGWPRNEPALVRGAAYLTSPRCRPSWGANQRNIYALYYTAQTLHNLGGADWERWYRDVSELLIDRQQRTGTMRGSWHPFRPAGAFQERSRDGGRLYLTALCVLTLETPFRHAPIYERPAQ